MSDVVVITGASAGVGRAVARLFAARGCRIALLARGEAALRATAAEVRDAGGEALSIPVDVADAEAVDAAGERIERELGPISIWINCAMTTIFGPLTEMSAEEFRRVTEVTYLGYVHGTMTSLKHMRRRRRGTIVQVGSALAYRAIPLQSAYCGAKFAIRGFTDSLRSELRHDGFDIHLTMVQLPAVNTPQFDWCRNKMPRRAQPVPPIYDPAVAAEAILFAAYARRREVWVGASAIKAIAANKIAPALLDGVLAKRGYSGQLSRARNDQRDDNLFAPRPGDHGTRGRFGAHARHWSWTLWISRNRAAIATIVLASTGLALLAQRRAAPMRPSIAG